MAPAQVWTIARTWPLMASELTPSTLSSADVRLSELDERALVDACLSHTPGAFDLIVEPHKRSVYLLCYRFAGHHEDASDLSKDVFLRAYRGLANFRGQSSLATWLYRIAVNVCLNRASIKTPLATARQPIEPDQFVDERSGAAAERLLRHERGARVRAAIAKLPGKQRATIVLRVCHEMSHQEIAVVLGSSVGA